jgi:hypothetical protein
MKLAGFNRFARRHFLSNIDLALGPNCKYDTLHLINPLLTTAKHHVCTHEGFQQHSEIYPETPSSSTLLYRLHNYPDPAKLIAQLQNKIDLTLELCMRTRTRQPVDVAIDLTSVPFYGNSDSPFVSRIKPERGTSHAYVFAVACIAERGFRPVIVLFLKRKEENHFDVLQRLLVMIKQRGIQIRRLFLDRGFYSSSVIDHLNRRGIRFLMPAIENRRVRRLVLLSAVGTHMKFRLGTAVYTLMVVDYRTFGKRGFATNIAVTTERESQELVNMYRQRWDIETCFRQVHDRRARTTSKDTTVRQFYFFMSVLIFNIWVLLNLAISPIRGYARATISLVKVIGAFSIPCSILDMG